MKTSRRVRRMQKFRQRSRPSGLNLVSLMDIFTILVFFLLVNSSATPELPSYKDLKLPDSVSQTVAEENLTVAITEEHILVQGTSVARIAELQGREGEAIDSLKERLLFLAKDYADDMERAITIAGHQDIDYELLRKVLRSCQEAGFYNIAFAANQVARPQVLEP